MAKRNEGKRQRVGQRGAREASMRLCVSCEDHFTPYPCKVCEKETVMDRCRLCHNEIVHGIIKAQYIRPHFGGGPAGPMEDDGGPWQQNALKDWENG